MASSGRKSLFLLSPVAYVSLCITLGMPLHPTVFAQEVTAKELPALEARVASSQYVDADTTLPDDPFQSKYPAATLVAPDPQRSVSMDAITQKRVGDVYTLDGDVVIVSESYILHADHVEYDASTGDVTASGHLLLTGGTSQERISASHATLNLKLGTGRFYDVIGSVGLRGTPENHLNVYTNGNPFLFTGKLVVKSGPEHYDIYDGTVTSCQLPHPDWQLASKRFSVHNGKASASNSFFRLLNVPVFYLPYVTHPVEEEARQSGLMIPVFGQSSSKGFVIGEEFYLAINRSTDLTVGAQYYSERGWEQSATYRYKGPGMNFLTVRYSGLLDRGYTPSGGVYTNQGGEDFVLSGRKDIGDHLRIAADVEYLSSYVYREAFSNTFNQAVASDINSIAYGTYQNNGIVASMRADRYQGLKSVQTATQEEQQVRIFHAPSIDLDILERPLGHSKLVWSAESSAAVLKRVQNNFLTDINERFDLHPQISLPLSGGGWKLRPSMGMRETLYSHSKTNTTLPGPNPTEVYSHINRAAFEAGVDLRAPVLERTFDTAFLQRFLGRSAKHTIEPYLNYRYRTGINDFSSILRFDTVDVVSNTNEIEYGITQRLFLRPTKLHPCKEDETPDEEGGECGGTRESLLWKLAQKRFFDKTFGGALVVPAVVPPPVGSPPGTEPTIMLRRNVLDTTLDFSGVAFLTDERTLSPILSQMRLFATDQIDLEWDLNYDTHAGKFTQSNVFVNYHVGNYFGGVSHARLNAPGRFQTGTTVSATSDFSQLRLLLGYGSPTKQGLSVATNVGVDLKTASVQYGAIQTSYNWNCCGISVEYRKFELGPVRNENVYRFNFTLANIGTAGNLKRAERLF